MKNYLELKKNVLCDMFVWFVYFYTYDFFNIERLTDELLVINEGI